MNLFQLTLVSHNTKMCVTWGLGVHNSNEFIHTCLLKRQMLNAKEILCRQMNKITETLKCCNLKEFDFYHVNLQA